MSILFLAIFEFLSTLSLRRATWDLMGDLSYDRNFYPRSPCGERQQAKALKIAAHNISIHALLAESDMRQRFIKLGKLRFLSTLSLRRATFRHWTTYLNCSHFYPRSPCGERQRCQALDISARRISIHALLAESDNARRASRQQPAGISIHALLAESDNILCMVSVQIGRFLSTLSLRRATHTCQYFFSNFLNFYPRSPCGERHLQPGYLALIQLFLSTLSLRRATAKVHKTVGHFCAYETNFMEIASSC